MRPMSAAAGVGGRWRPTPFGLLGDERLAQRVGAGDERAFVSVYERYHQILYRYCRSLLRNDADAQDALQSTFAAAFAALRAGQRDAPMRPWLFRIAHNESISMLRRRRPVFELSAAREPAARSIEDQVAERAELSVLLRDLHQLTDRQRSALVLRELNGLSHQEIAIALGTSVGAAKQTIFEARQSLFEFAEGRAMACDEIRKTISDADGRTLRSRRVRAHLRECGGCAAFAAAIPSRAGELRALAPALSGAAAAGLFGRIAISGAGPGGGAGLARLAAGAAVKTASAGAGFGANALAGVAVVATATAGVTVGVGKIVQAMSHRESVLGAQSAAAIASHGRAGTPSPRLGMASSPDGQAHGVLGASAQGAGSTDPHRTVIGLRGAVGATGSRTVIIGRPGWPERSGNDGASAQSDPGAAYASAGGYRWRGGPARLRSDPAPSPGASASGASGNAGSTHGGSAGSGTTRRGGSGKPSWAGSRHPGSQRGSQRESAPATGASPVLRVNAPVLANVSGSVGKATTAVGPATTTVGPATTTVGTVTTTVGSVTSTVSGALPVKPGASTPSTPTLPPLSLPDL
jgi:RNA polymerase sigma factor (sigma-70 family)